MKKEEKAIYILIISALALILAMFMCWHYLIDDNDNKVAKGTVWKVEITDVSITKKNGNGYAPLDPTYDHTTAHFNTNLYTGGDSVTYTIVVTNKGSIDAVLDSVNIISNSLDDSVIYNIEGDVSIKDDGYVSKTKLKAGATNIITVIADYNNLTNGYILDPTKEMSVVLNYIQNKG